MAHYGSIHSTRQLLLSLAAFTLLSSPTIAQVGTLLDHSKLPNCAFSCQTLLNAQSACVPSGGAPTTNQATYQSCFCQSAYLTQFKSASYDICNGVCSATQLQQIQSWYTSLCDSGVVVTPGGSAATSSGSSPSSATASSSTSGAHEPSNKGASNQTWIGTHYGWVIMIIVLILAGLVAIFGGLWLKRRYERRHDMGFRESTLMADEAAAALRNRHPEFPSMVQLPPSGRNLDRKARDGAITPAGARDAVGGRGRGRGKGKGRAHENELGENSDNLVHGALDKADESTLRRGGSKLKSRSSSKKSRSRRER